MQLSSSDLVVPPHGSIRIQAKSVRQGRMRKATWRCHRAAGPVLFLILLPSQLQLAPVFVTSSMPRQQTREFEPGRRRRSG